MSHTTQTPKKASAPQLESAGRSPFAMTARLFFGGQELRNDVKLGAAAIGAAVQEDL